MSAEAENTPPMQELRRQLDMAQSQLAAYARDFKHTVDELRASEARFRAMVETTSDWIWEADENDVYTYASPKVQDLLGYAPEEVVGRTPFDLMPAEEAQRVAGLFGEIVRNRQPFELLENANLHRDGRVVILESSGVPVFDRSGDFRGYRGIDRDITERKRAEAKIQLFRNLLDHSSDGIFIVNPATSRFLDVNEAACRDLLYARDELLQRGVVDIQTTLPDAAAWQAHVQELRAQGKALLEFDALRKDGSRFPVEASIEYVTIENQAYIIAVVRNITERKQAERALRRLNRALKTLSACNEVLVRATDETQLLNAMCKQIVETGRYRMAWVGLVERDGEHRIRRAAQAGCTAGFLDTHLAQVKGEGDWCPTIRAVRTGTVQIVEDISADSTFPHWREEVLRLGVLSCLALPLLQDSQVLGSLTLYSAEAATFSKDELDLLLELAADTSFGISTLRMRKERDHYQLEHLKSAERLKEALIGTIRAIALTVEKRDPYTAGHQSRVADLAAAIAGELGLDADHIEGMKLGAMIHDIGKIYVPAEILNRPGRLSVHEFGMIKTHPEVGYDIIKDVKFPWPVALMVLQHHERMDGSGYPKGLKGEEIILEARILAVADVVEAITAHRPYRPALGFDVALAEIEAKRGQLYDPNVVDACLRLFREKGYTLENNGGAQ
ncbi:MAG: PAS domain S-box protein [Sulfuricella sp.]|nr:PAS domain S-box protein [Sulfuricella sp.]